MIRLEGIPRGVEGEETLLCMAGCVGTGQGLVLHVGILPVAISLWEQSRNIDACYNFSCYDFSSVTTTFFDLPA